MGQALRHDGSAAALGAARILLVEDSFFILMELEAALLEAGAAEVCVCRTVREAMSTLETQPVSVAILDIQLDRESGVEVARKLARERIPFLFYTGQLDIHPVHTEWPDCRVISKPATREAIVAAVADLLH